MTSDSFFPAFSAVFIVGAIGFALFRAWRKSRDRDHGSGTAPATPPAQRSDAYFRTMFPELQPYFHPEKVVRFVRERNGTRDVVDGYTWRDAPGFNTATAVAAISGGRERIRLSDSGGATLAEFDYERQPNGAALRVGRGKLTAVLEGGNNPRVRYWHPEREFKWSRKGGWQFTTPMTESAFDSDDRGSRWSNDSASPASSSSSGSGGRVAAAAATAALVSGAGGAFAGGGASDQWDAAAGNDADPATGATAY